ncbi:MAG: SDR family oxidoreductase [Nitrospinae bacterium]|nr:SDR family oxidoreductase [Nitrospinota bacterium]
MRFIDKVAVITGGGSGIGRATAQLMAEEGGGIALVDVEPTSMNAVAESIETHGGTVMEVPADVLNGPEVERMVQTVLSRYGRIDILVNAVGGSTIIERSGAPVEELTLDEWERVLAFNLRGTFLCTHAVIPQMKHQGGGHIINLSSVAARGDSPRSGAAYAAAKAGIRALTRKLAIELGPYGVTCNAIAPSLTLSERIMQRTWGRRTPEEQKQMIEATPLKRVATPEDQARVILFLASDDAGFVSGQTIEVTGGQ